MCFTGKGGASGNEERERETDREKLYIAILKEI
jgi:hypothetical protein